MRRPIEPDVVEPDEFETINPLEPRFFLTAANIGKYAIFAGGCPLNNENPMNGTNTVDIFPLVQSHSFMVKGINSTIHISADIVLSNFDETLAKKQLQEWGKISHISARQNELVVRFFNELPNVPL